MVVVPNELQIGIVLASSIKWWHHHFLWTKSDDVITEINGIIATCAQNSY